MSLEPYFRAEAAWSQEQWRALAEQVARMREALELIADGTLNRNREACRIIALRALGRDDGTT